jgi:CubicO group peptidase (beta-lactamase class C family)
MPVRTLARFATAALFVAPIPARASAQTTDRTRIIASVDSMAAALLRTGPLAGMTVGIARGRDTILLKGYGAADIELNVATPDRAVYEIGSATKQFTASAILQLQEAGKLSLDDEITKFLPTYPTQGHTVTLRRLLDHTSGIRSYTEVAGFGTIMSRDLARDSLVAIFAPLPFDFAPGEAMVYNNSAFFLLGLVIEKASGMTYERYVKEKLFARAGMKDSRYCSNTEVVPRRAHGYDVGRGGLQLAAYIAHTWPYAAGSLCSTAGDLLTWTYALHHGGILSAASYRELITPSKLNDGTTIRYSKGLFVGDSLLGHPAIHHGGDIPGFTTEVAYLPDDSVTIVVLMNTEGPLRPDAVAQSIVKFMLGDRTPAGVRFTGTASDFVGVYRGVGRGRPLVLTFAAGSAGSAAGGLALKLPTGVTQALTYYGGDTFGQGSTRYTFVRQQGRVTAVRADADAIYSIAQRQVP